jgi:hypothetical protein
MFTRSIYLTKSIRNFNLKSFVIIIVVFGILISYLRFDEKCAHFFHVKKVPSIINSKKLDKNVPIVFIGGNYYSGMSLMKGYFKVDKTFKLTYYYFK